MNLMLHAMTIVAALLFIGVSATMNALFLSSLGRIVAGGGIIGGGQHCQRHQQSGAAGADAAFGLAARLGQRCRRCASVAGRRGAVPGIGDGICCADARYGQRRRAGLIPNRLRLRGRSCAKSTRVLPPWQVRAAHPSSRLRLLRFTSTGAGKRQNSAPNQIPLRPVNSAARYCGFRRNSQRHTTATI